MGGGLNCGSGTFLHLTISSLAGAIHRVPEGPFGPMCNMGHLFGWRIEDDGRQNRLRPADRVPATGISKVRPYLSPASIEVGSADAPRHVRGEGIQVGAAAEPRSDSL
jgi:hypothetical protein